MTGGLDVTQFVIGWSYFAQYGMISCGKLFVKISELSEWHHEHSHQSFHRVGECTAFLVPKYYVHGCKEHTNYRVYGVNNIV